MDTLCMSNALDEIELRVLTSTKSISPTLKDKPHRAGEATNISSAASDTPMTHPLVVFP